MPRPLIGRASKFELLFKLIPVTVPAKPSVTATCTAANGEDRNGVKEVEFLKLL